MLLMIMPKITSLEQAIEESKKLESLATKGPWIDGGLGKTGTLPDLKAMPFGAPLYAKPTSDEEFIAHARTWEPKYRRMVEIVKNYLTACKDEKLEGNKYQAAEMLDVLGEIVEEDTE